MVGIACCLGRIGALAGALILAGCAQPTPYQAALDDGYGYDGRQIGDTRFRVTFAGNRSTPRETVESYLLYRAAEVTLQRGYDAFVVVDKDTERFARYTTSGPRFGFGYGHGWGHPYHYRSPAWYSSGSYGPATTSADYRYTASATILMRRGPGPWTDPDVYDARAVARHLGPEVARPPETDPAGVAPYGVDPLQRGPLGDGPLG